MASSVLLIQNVSPLRSLPTEFFSSNNCVTLQIEPKTLRSNSINQQSKSDTYIIQLTHNPAAEHQLFVLFPNEICLVETQHHQLIYSAVIDTGSPLAQVRPFVRLAIVYLVKSGNMHIFLFLDFNLKIFLLEKILLFSTRYLILHNNFIFLKLSSRYTFMFHKMK